MQKSRTQETKTCESKTLEFKEKISSTFLKTVSAYANYESGCIIFGVSDDGLCVGIENLEQACLSIENKINDSVSPVPDFTLEVNTNNKTIELSVDKGIHTPYFYKSKAYRRSSTSTVEVDRVELSRLVLSGQNMTFDETPANSCNLSFSALSARLENALGVSAINDDILKTLELKDAQGNFNVAAELLSDTNTFSGIDIARFGSSISIFKERATYELESVLLQYDHAIEFYKRYYVYEEISGATRKHRESIPQAAFRECIANALVHRHWDVPACVRVSMFEDKIEVVSPGGLPCGISEREYLSGQVSMLRNPILGNVFFRLGIIERFGTGVLRIKDSYQGSATQPAFEITENAIKVVLPVWQDELDLPEDAACVYRIVKGKTLAISEIAALAKFGKSKTRDILKQLAAGGYVEVLGRGRATKYRG